MRRAMLAVALLALPAGSWAQGAGDVAAGRQLAATWCANCHRVSPSGPGPVTDAAPAFASIAAMPSATEMSLRVFLRTPHRRMPNYALTLQEEADVIAYLLAQRPR